MALERQMGRVESARAGHMLDCPETVDNAHAQACRVSFFWIVSAAWRVAVFSDNFLAALCRNVANGKQPTGEWENIYTMGIKNTSLDDWTYLTDRVIPMPLTRRCYEQTLKIDCSVWRCVRMQKQHSGELFFFLSSVERIIALACTTTVFFVL